MKKIINYSQARQLGILMTIPFMLLMGPVLGMWLGGWVDKKIHSQPWGMIILSVLGLIASAREVFLMLKRVSKE